MTEEPIDELPGMITGADQFKSLMPMVAGLYMTHFRGCVEQGFTADQALQLTLGYAKSSLWPKGNDYE